MLNKAKMREAMKHKDIIDELKKRNPFPEDIFPPLSYQIREAYVRVLVDNGFSSDKIHAHWMRYSWNLCIEELENIWDKE